MYCCRLVQSLDGASNRSTFLEKAVQDCFIGRHFIFGIKVPLQLGFWTTRPNGVFYWMSLYLVFLISAVPVSFRTQEVDPGWESLLRMAPAVTLTSLPVRWFSPTPRASQAALWSVIIGPFFRELQNMSGDALIPAKPPDPRPCCWSLNIFQAASITQH